MVTSSFSQHFNGYDILGELGRGNARVLKAQRLATGTLVAIKHFSFNTDAGTIRRFQRESEIMTSIHHPNVVRIKEVQLDAVLPYIVMELVEGGDLRNLLKLRDRLDLATTLSLCRQMVEAFSAIHAKGITHRDIKPENIMCRPLPDGGFHFLLTDFGIARLREQPQTVTGATMMTYEYASPEQFDNPRSVTAATDYYSLGVVLYECVTGKVPFPLVDGRMHQFVNQVMKDHPPPIERYLPKSLHRLIQGLLAKNAGERIAGTAQVKQLLREAEWELRDYEVGENQYPDDDRKDTLAAPWVPPSKTLASPVAAPADRPAPISPAVRKRAGLTTFLFTICFFVAVAGGGWLFFYKYKAWRKSNNRRAQDTTHPVKPSPEVAPGEKQGLAPDSSTYHDGQDTAMLEDTYLMPDENDAQPDIVSPETNTYPTQFADDFSNNDNGWPLMADADGEIKVDNSHIQVKGLSDDYSYPSTRHFGLDTGKDFVASVNARWAGGNKEDGFGIDYCWDESNSSGYSFYITADGYYCIRYTKDNGDWQVINDWTGSDLIKRGTDWNLLTVRREGSTMQFLINNRTAATIPFKQPFGSGFGVRVGGAQTVDFDDFKLEGLAKRGHD